MSAPSRPPNAQSQSGKQPPNVSATYLREKDVQNFSRNYHQQLATVRQLESTSKDLNEIAAANMRMATMMNGFLRAVRSVPRVPPNSPDATLVSLDQLRALELECQMRMVRAMALLQAQSLDLGSVVVSSLDQNRLQQDIRREVERLQNEGPGGGSGSEADESQEEKNPQNVDLDKSEGLYSIIDANQAPGLSDLIGYSNEAASLLNLTRDIKFVGQGLDETSSTSSNNRPVAIILYGPPGTGKTTSAQAVAKTLGFTYMYVNAENVTSMWAGGTQKNISKVFRRARIAAKKFRRKTLLLIDEVDGLLKNRQGGASLTGEEYSRITTFLQMLTPPVGVDNSDIVCMFTTNNLENLDPAFVNRARQSLFLGYILKPEDRAVLFRRLLGPYVNPSDDNWIKMAYYCPEFVPRDIVNLVSLARTTIAKRYEQVVAKNGGAQTLVIPLSDSRFLLSIAELYDLTHSMSPATPVSSYFSYSPPEKHITDWLALNGAVDTQVRPNVVDAFRVEYARIGGVRNN